MDDPNQAMKLVKQRQRDAVELLLTDSRLRDALTDEQAGRLFDWAFRIIKEAAAQTAAMSGDTAEFYMEAQVTAVRRLLLSVNHLVAELAWLTDSEATFQVNQFLTSLNQLSRPLLYPTPIDLLAPERPTWAKNNIFEQRMLILDSEEEE